VASIQWLDQIRQVDHSQVGSKLARLAVLRTRGLPVPDGFAVPSAVCAEFVAPLRAQLAPLLEVSGSDFPDLQRRCAAARQIIEAQAHSVEFAQQIVEAVAELGLRTGLGDSLSMAVRSSGVLEDLEGASFAGQYESYLGMRSAGQVLDCVRRCWASQYTARAVDYRLRHGLPALLPGIGAGVMQLVRSRAAGVTFTLNPLTGDTTHAVVEANWGFGESVVSGEVTPDRWVIRKSDGDIVDERIADKEVWSVFDPEQACVVEQACPLELRRNACLSPAEVRHVVEIAVEIESREGRPQDVEWAIDEGLTFPNNLFVLQHRPETTWRNRAPAPTEHTPYDPVAYAMRHVFGIRSNQGGTPA
jgi:pyruvate,water dikinase